MNRSGSRTTHIYASMLYDDICGVYTHTGNRANDKIHVQKVTEIHTINHNEKKKEKKTHRANL